MAKYSIGWLCLWILLAGIAGQTGGQSVEGLPDALKREVHDIRSLPAGRYLPAGQWEAEGKEAAHQVGRAVADPEASGGKAWEVRVGVDSPGGHLLYGPYRTLSPGVYVAFVRIRLLEEAGEETVGELDAATAYGQNILRVRELLGTHLATNRYVEVPLAFAYPEGKFECRLAWSGSSGLRVDCVTLFRVEGAKLEVASERARPPVPSGLPKNLAYRPEPRPFPDIFPRSARPAARLWVADLRHLPPDRQLMLLSLQGLVNRKRPEIYCLFNDTDEKWLAWMRRRRWIRDATPVSQPESLVTRFRDRLRGLIVTDPMLPASKNVATMLAGVKDALVVSPRLAKRLSLPVLEDLRGRWRTSAEAYRWAFNHLWPRLNHHVLACSYPDHLGLRDYLVQHRVFIFWLSGPIDGARPYANPDAEVRLMERLFARMPANIPVMSYPWAGKDVGIGEGPGVTLFAEFAKYLVGSINCSNLSVHSGIRAPSFRQRVPPPPKLQPNRVYVSWVISDGDNLPVLTTSNFPQLWQDRQRGHLPLGWTISPSASILIPDIVDYYYRTATPSDCFLGAVSGIGYTYPDSYALRYRASDRTRLFDGFLDQTADYMQRLDLRALWPMNVTRPELIRRYAERIPTLQALFPDYGRRVACYEDAVYPTARNIPVFHAVTNWAEGVSREQQIASLVGQIRAMTPMERPAFLHLFALNWFTDLPMLAEITRRLGPEYVLVRPDHLAALYRQELARRKILVRVPATIVGIEGQPVAFEATVQNVSARSLEARAGIAVGLANAQVRPERVRLAPGQAVKIQVAGLPTGDRIRIAVEGAGRKSRSLLALRRIAEGELAGPLPHDASLRFVRRFAAVELAHRSGREETDTGGQRVWTAQRGETESGFLVYGPYAPLPPGRYLALFRLKRIGEGGGTVATLDTCTSGGTRIISERRLRAEELPPEQYRAVPLLFDHPGGEIETRVQWTGNASLAVESITLWRLLPSG